MAHMENFGGSRSHDYLQNNAVYSLPRFLPPQSTNNASRHPMMIFPPIQECPSQSTSSSYGDFNEHSEYPQAAQCIVQPRHQYPYRHNQYAEQNDASVKVEPLTHYYPDSNTLNQNEQHSHSHMPQHSSQPTMEWQDSQHLSSEVRSHSPPPSSVYFQSMTSKMKSNLIGHQYTRSHSPISSHHPMDTRELPSYNPDQTVTSSLLSDFPTMDVSSTPVHYSNQGYRGTSTQLPYFTTMSPRGVVIPAVNHRGVSTVSPAPSLVSISSCSTHSVATPTRMSFSRASSAASTPSSELTFDHSISDSHCSTITFQSVAIPTNNEIVSSRCLFSTPSPTPFPNLTYPNAMRIDSNREQTVSPSSHEESALFRVPRNRSARSPRRYQCHICAKVLSHPGSLSRHVRGHTNDRPYACQLCARRFQQAGNLKVHLRSHTDDKPYQCDDCARKFRHPSTLSTHRRKKHSLMSS